MHWEHRVLAIGPPGKSCKPGIFWYLIPVSSSFLFPSFLSPFFPVLPPSFLLLSFHPLTFLDASDCSCEEQWVLKLEKWIRGQILEGLNCERKECNLQPEGNSELLKVVEQKQNIVKVGTWTWQHRLGRNTEGRSWSHTGGAARDDPGDQGIRAGRGATLGGSLSQRCSPTPNLPVGPSQSTVRSVTSPKYLTSLNQQ